MKILYMANKYAQQAQTSQNPTAQYQEILYRAGLMGWSTDPGNSAGSVQLDQSSAIWTRLIAPLLGKMKGNVSATITVNPGFNVSIRSNQPLLQRALAPMAQRMSAALKAGNAPHWTAPVSWQWFTFSLS